MNGHLSDWFSLQRGCRQGDPLSPYIFIFCAEVLIEMVRSNTRIKGIIVTDSKFKLSQYADDTTFLLDGSEDSLRHSLLTFKLYASFPGLNINMDKTKVVWIGSMKGSNLRFCEDNNLCWEEQFTVLGIKFTLDLQQMIPINYESKLEEIQKLLSSWSKRMLTPYGKITVIKNSALSKITHLILALHTHSTVIVNQLQMFVFNFVWNNASDRIKRKVIIQDYDMGGLRLDDVKKIICGLKLSWIRRLSSSNKKYLYVVKDSYPFLENFEIFGMDYISQRRNRIDNLFWNDIFGCYQTFS